MNAPSHLVQYRGHGAASWFACGRCGRQIDRADHYCRHCGVHLMFPAFEAVADIEPAEPEQASA